MGTWINNILMFKHFYFNHEFTMHPKQLLDGLIFPLGFDFSPMERYHGPNPSSLFSNSSAR
jgi:hypothetical protein